MLGMGMGLWFLTLKHSLDPVGAKQPGQPGYVADERGPAGCHELHRRGANEALSSAARTIT
jgi:hypothetical protein